MNKKTEAFARILTIMNELREQCPWDKKQTIESLRHLTIEETYELSDAIVKNDWKNIKEELGDLLLHIVFYAKIGEEQGETDIADVINVLCDKLIKRHPHIYGNTGDDENLREVQSEEDVKKNWEQLKLKEGRKSVLGGVPNSLPSLVKAFRIQEKAGQVGFEWDNIEDVWKKVEEELEELQVEMTAVAKGEKTAENADISKVQSEFGDVMFALVNYARYLNLDPEYCLELSNQKFINRFRYIEETAQAQGKNLKDMTLGEMDEIWNAAKRKKMKTLVYTLDDVPNIAKQILAEFPDERVFLLQGTLGAGKTTLIKAFCEALDVASDLSSPSFSIINEYADKNGNTIAYHADLYRLKSAQEAEAIGFHEYLDSGKYCFIEWFEIIEDYVSGTKLSIQILADDKREITIS